MLELLKDWLADERLGERRLALITHGAFAVHPGAPPADIAQAGVWGLVRSAQAEEPGRFVLIDCDDQPSSWAALGAALSSGEPQLALRAGELLAPRLTRASAAPSAEPAPSPEPELSLEHGTVLITGATGTLGSLIAAHLVARYGARELLLLSRQGEQAPGARELAAQLKELGASSVGFGACDVGSRAQLERVLGALQSPLCAVVHAAGVLDDGVIGSLNAQRLDSVLEPKADAAWHLHELTGAQELKAFVLFSSAAGTIGAPGQGNYAAANAFLDALAQRRVAEGQPASSIAWGLWERASAMSSTLSEADRARMARGGLGALSDQQGLELFDAALESSQALSLAASLDLAPLRAHARTGALPAIFSALVRAPAQPPGARQGALQQRLSAAGEPDRERLVLEEVLGHIAAVLGHPSPQSIDPSHAFLELGFDSLTAVELRNRLGQASGLRLAPTLVFDYPTPAQLSRHVLELLAQDASAAQDTFAGELDRLEGLLHSLADDASERSKVQQRLQALLASLQAQAEAGQEDDVLDSASDEEMFELIDKELGQT